jgi:ribosome biogenesis GTPase A
MHKASKEMAEILPQVDVIIELLDARLPYSSSNPFIKKLRSRKPGIKLLSKSDLADPAVTRLWSDHFDQQDNTKTLAVNTDQADRSQQIIALCQKLVPGRGTGEKPIVAMITGIPNVGKSTLINSMAGRSIAKTGNEPAITKGQQRINLKNGLILLDTPGILWPKVENEKSSYRLATTGAIKDTAMSYTDVAFFAVDYMQKHYPELLRERFALDTVPATELEFLEWMGARRGCLRSGGQVDLERVCTIFLNELRSGMIGQISLETPAMVALEEAQLIVLKAENEARKKAMAEERKKRGRQTK